MADNSLNESFTCIKYIKKEIHFLNVKKIYLSQIKSLINKLLYGYNNDESNKNDHLYSISYFIEQIRQLNEKSILLLEKMNKGIEKK